MEVKKNSNLIKQLKILILTLLMFFIYAFGINTLGNSFDYRNVDNSQTIRIKNKDHSYAFQNCALYGTKYYETSLVEPEFKKCNEKWLFDTLLLSIMVLIASWLIVKKISKNL